MSACPFSSMVERDERGPVLLGEDRLRVERLAAVFEVDQLMSALPLHSFSPASMTGTSVLSSMIGLVSTSL